jgi:DNA-binding NtrC family response regulator
MTEGLVLCIEREEIVRRLYECIAHQAGVPIRAVGTPQEAEQYLPQAGLLVVGSHGIEFAKTANHNSNHLGKIVITGNATLSPQSYQQLGVHEVWKKPMEREHIAGLFTKYTSPKARILCMDDDETILSLYEIAVKQAGGIPVRAANSIGAMPHLTSVHAVISDVCQPVGEGGYGLLARARELYDRDQLPFILITGGKFEKEKTSGATFLLEKPISIDQLRAYVDCLIPQHLRPRDAA